MQPGWMARVSEEELNDFLGLHFNWFLRIRDRLPPRRQPFKAKEALWLMRWLSLEKNQRGEAQKANSELVLTTLARVWNLPWFHPFTTTPEACRMLAEHCVRNNVGQHVIVRLSSSVPGQLVTSEMRDGQVVHMRFESVGKATLYAQATASHTPPPLDNGNSYSTQPSQQGFGSLAA